MTKSHSHHNETHFNHSGAIRDTSTIRTWDRTTPTDSDAGRMNGSAKGALPDVSNVLMGSGKVFKELSMQVQNIQGQLNAMQNENVQEVAKQRAEYEEQLEVQKAEVAAAEAKNAKITGDTEELRKTNRELRKKASVLSAICQKVRVSVTQMESNATVAMEFMQQTLNTSEAIFSASETKIMRELDEQDVLMQKQLAHSKRMSSLGMLQFSSVTSAVNKRSKHYAVREGLPEKLVEGMLASLEDYKKQKLEHENDLKKLFETRFRAGVDQLQALREEHNGLQAAYQAEKELQGKLVLAVQHLEKTYQQLLRQKQSLLKFFHNMGEGK